MPRPDFTPAIAALKGRLLHCRTDDTAWEATRAVAQEYALDLADFKTAFAVANAMLPNHWALRYGLEEVGERAPVARIRTRPVSHQSSP